MSRRGLTAAEQRLLVRPASLTAEQRAEVLADLTGGAPPERRRMTLLRRGAGVSLTRPPADACWVTTVRADGTSWSTCRCAECVR